MPCRLVDMQAYCLQFSTISTVKVKDENLVYNFENCESLRNASSLEDSHDAGSAKCIFV